MGAVAAVAAAVTVLGVVPAAETVAVTGTVAAAQPAAAAAVSAAVAAVSAAAAAAAAVAAAVAVAPVGCQMEAWACQVAWQTRMAAQGTCHKRHMARHHEVDPLACMYLWAAWPQACELMQGMHCQC